MTLYSAPTTECRTEQEVKKSRFIGIIAPCKCREDAIEKLKQLKSEYPDARHICWAFVCGTPGNYSDYGFSDDGEPSGTAGKPILNVLQHNPVSDISTFVVRYFGGIKLGAGGLVRAYSSAASITLENTKLQAVIPTSSFVIDLPYPLEDRIRRLIEEYQGSIQQQNYSEIVSISITLPTEHEMIFTAQCTDIGKGDVCVRELHETV